jgi:enoyl-CoA hydratase/carnithine racemase
MIEGGTAIPLPTDLVLAGKRDGVGWLTLNNPAKRNAISLAMWEGIAVAVADFIADPALRVVVMQGAGGKSFAAGADISEFAKRDADPEAAAADARRLAAARAVLDGLQKPLIAMIRGYCVGGGLALALRADLRLASADSQFGIPAAKLGIAYAAANMQRLTALVGPGFAKEMLFTGMIFGAETALARGLVNRVVAAEALAAEVLAMARQIAGNAPLSLRAAAASIDHFAGDPRGPDPARLDELARLCAESEDFREGQRAFREKRQPAFVGR